MSTIQLSCLDRGPVRNLTFKIDAKSKTQGLPKSRLPEFSPEDAEEIAGTSDFLGINFYTASIVTPKEAPDDYDINYFADSDIHSYQDETWHRCVITEER